MKCIIGPSEAERHTLQQLSVNHRHRDIRTRAADLLLLGNGLSPPKVAAELDVSAQSIYNRCRLWEEQGVGLLSGHGGGRPRALSESMLAKAMEVARTESMTLGQIAKRIEVVHGGPMPCALETLSVALPREGCSFKRNRFSPKKSATRKTLG
ncbi:helix-turn-helix domain protein [Paraburkholderia fungorum]|uniref:Helix-turn-helix domain protein n=2 Tax=Paraburkholderia fungorum TaxID=134537 RepID=A0AAU8SXJ1_9BURK|nr:helix-turn-helix domain protein [Paraburkholderia fungorum]